MRSFSFTFDREQKGQTINKQREFISSTETGNREDRIGERERQRLGREERETETRKRRERESGGEIESCKKVAFGTPRVNIMDIHNYFQKQFRRPQTLIGLVIQLSCVTQILKWSFPTPIEARHGARINGPDNEAQLKRIISTFRLLLPALLLALLLERVVIACQTESLPGTEPECMQSITYGKSTRQIYYISQFIHSRP